MMEGLGRLFDLSVGSTIAVGTANITGKRVSLKNASGCTVLLVKAAGTSGQDPVLTFNAYAAASGGSAQSGLIPPVDHFFKKAIPVPTGSETWSRVTQTASNVVTLTGESTNAGLYAFYVAAGDSAVRSDPYLEVDIGSTAAAQNNAVLFILHDLAVQRAPNKLASAQA